MSTGAIIAIVVIVVILLIALLVLMPRARKQAAERKAEHERRERERRLERERQEAAEQHRSEADNQRHQAELAEAEAKKQRAEADINAKHAELHEQGLADEKLTSGGAAGAGPGAGAANGRGDYDRTLERDDGAQQAAGSRASGPVDEDRDRDAGGVRDVSGGRAHEPAAEGDATEFERGRERGHEDVAGDASSEGGRRFVPEEEQAGRVEEERRPAR